MISWKTSLIVDERDVYIIDESSAFLSHRWSPAYCILKYCRQERMMDFPQCLGRVGWCRILGIGTTIWSWAVRYPWADRRPLSLQSTEIAPQHARYVLLYERSNKFSWGGIISRRPCCNPWQASRQEIWRTGGSKALGGLVHLLGYIYRK